MKNKHLQQTDRSIFRLAIFHLLSIVCLLDVQSTTHRKDRIEFHQ